jgi:hypothetical protein
MHASKLEDLVRIVRTFIFSYDSIFSEEHDGRKSSYLQLLAHGRMIVRIYVVHGHDSAELLLDLSHVRCCRVTVWALCPRREQQTWCLAVSFERRKRAEIFVRHILYEIIF